MDAGRRSALAAFRRPRRSRPFCWPIRRFPRRFRASVRSKNSGRAVRFRAILVPGR